MKNINIAWNAKVEINGITGEIVISNDLSKMAVLVILIILCQQKQRWKMFFVSIDLWRLKYTTYVGDRNSALFGEVQDALQINYDHGYFLAK